MNFERGKDIKEILQLGSARQLIKRLRDNNIVGESAFIEYLEIEKLIKITYPSDLQTWIIQHTARQISEIEKENIGELKMDQTENGIVYEMKLKKLFME
jgi:hypothetical protein